MDYINISKSFLVNKKSSIPYYFQLKQYIIQEIESGNWVPGKQIIPEIKMCELFDISRTVVRQTFQELANEGYFIKEKAKGTFVAKPKIDEDLVQKLTGFYEDMNSRGYKVTNDILSQTIVPAPQKIAEELKIKNGEKLIAINRLRKINSEPIVLDTTYIPYDLCPELLEEDFTGQSLYAYLERKHNFKIEEGVRTIEVTIAKEKEARILNIKKGDPLFVIQNVSYLKNGQAFEYYHAYHRGDRSRFVVKLRRDKKDNGDLRNQFDSKN